MWTVHRVAAPSPEKTGKVNEFESDRAKKLGRICNV